MESLIWLVSALALCSGVLTEQDISGCREKCLTENSNNGLYLVPHQNCSLMCSCMYGTAYVFTCTEGLHYSEVDGTCTYQLDAKCEISEEIEDPITDLSRLVGPANSQCMGHCPLTNAPQQTVTLEHEDCDKFCKCVKGVAHVNDCPAGFHFSPVLGVCTYPEEAHCTRCTSPSPNPVPTPIWCPCPNTTVPEISTTTVTVTPITTVTVLPTTTVTEIPTTIVTTMPTTTTTIISTETDTESLTATVTTILPTTVTATPITTVTVLPTTTVTEIPTTIVTTMPTKTTTIISTATDTEILTTTATAILTTTVTEIPITTVTEIPITVTKIPTTTVTKIPTITVTGIPTSITTTTCITTSAAVIPTTVTVTGPAITVTEIPTTVTEIPTSTLTVTCITPSSTISPTSVTVTATPTSTPGSGPGLEGCIGTCPLVDPIRVVHLPHMYCSKFCKCSHGVPTLMGCQPNTYFNPTLQTCVFPPEDNCKGIRD
ncbi:mucin-2-like [Diachasmimorpha longicaudata]|uniref:mucin-2-like n=1 Tax=Diachasmimorpha longicaudata TaxID=58733 RepID=UPI0030B8E281